jgi:hypothetical protein
MAEPNTRQDFLAYCLGMLGAGGGNPQDPTNIYKGIINIAMTPFQADNCISRALTLWRTYHFEATQRTYYKQMIDSTILNQMWVPCPDSIQDVIRVLDISQDNLSIFDIRYQLRLLSERLQQVIVWMYNFANCWKPLYIV